jgi:REP element-mobilizing transposase RayT
LVIPGLPHHVTQRGNRRQQTFFNEGDYAAYLELMAEWCREKGVEIWGYCLMPNHAHLLAVPSSADGLRWAIGETHRRYAADQLPRKMARVSLARAFCFIRHGRAPLAGGRTVRGAKPGVSATGGLRRRLALEQRAGAPVGTR